MIQFRNYSFRYENSVKNALSDICLTIEQGDFLGIIGNSGAGKTSLIYSINGVIPHHFSGDFYGSVLVNGLDTVTNSAEKLSVLVGSVFQDIDAQMIGETVEDNLLFALENFGIPRDKIESRINEALEFTGIAALRSRTVQSLSGGQKQKVAVSAVLALRPEILVLDEPSGELDPASSRQLFSVLRMLNETYGTTIVIVEQKIMLLCEFCKHLCIMQDGRIALHGDIASVLAQSERMKTLGVHVPRIVELYDGLYRSGRLCPVKNQQALFLCIRHKNRAFAF